MILYIILGFFAGILATFSSVALMYYVKERKSENNQYQYYEKEKIQSLFLQT